MASDSYKTQFLLMKYNATLYLVISRCLVHITEMYSPQNA